MYDDLLNHTLARLSSGAKKTVEQLLGDAIRAQREALGLSQEQLAFECGLHRTYISQLERGMKSPTVRVLFALAKALKTTPEKLIEQVSNPNV